MIVTQAKASRTLCWKTMGTGNERPCATTGCMAWTFVDDATETITGGILMPDPGRPPGDDWVRGRVHRD